MRPRRPRRGPTPRRGRPGEPRRRPRPGWRLPGCARGEPARRGSPRRSLRSWSCRSWPTGARSRVADARPASAARVDRASRGSSPEGSCRRLGPRGATGAPPLSRARFRAGASPGAGALIPRKSEPRPSPANGGRDFPAVPIACGLRNESPAAARMREVEETRDLMRRDLMRHDRGSSGDLRWSALWGKPSKGETRSSALWGECGRGFLATLVVAVGLAAPVAYADSGSDSPSFKAYTTPGLIAKAQAAPRATSDVIVVGADRPSGWLAKQIANFKSTKAKIRKQYRSINGVAARLTGSQILALARNGHVASITYDSLVVLAGGLSN